MTAQVAAVDVAGTESFPDTQPGSVGLTCAPVVAGLAGCAGDETCVPKSTSEALCIEAEGDVPCPEGVYTNRIVVGAPGDVDDTRQCTECTCSSSAASCNGATFAGYNDGNCSSPASPAKLVGGQCNSPQSGNWNGDDHFIYTASPSGATCGTKVASDLQGEIKPKSPTTICCAP